MIERDFRPVFDVARVVPHGQGLSLLVDAPFSYGDHVIEPKVTLEPPPFS
jgi:hypothetical protein